jgi:hypothetical protein
MRLTTPRSSRQDAPGAIDDLYQVLRPEITLHLHQLVEGLHTLVQAAGALAASGHSVRGYDGEPSSTASPKLVHCRVRLAPRGSRGSRRIAGVWFALVVGGTDPKGWRPWLGALLLAYHDPEGRLVYAGRVGTGIRRPSSNGCRADCSRSLPTECRSTRRRRFGSPLVLSRVHWVRPELVAEVKYLTWTDDNLLRQVVYEGLREDKPAAEVRRPVPHPKAVTADSTATRSRRRCG